jgi:hypothetical protein
MKKILALLFLMMAVTISQAQSVSYHKLPSGDSLMVIENLDMKINYVRVMMERGVVDLAKVVENGEIRYHLTFIIVTTIVNDNEDYGVGIILSKKYEDCGHSFIVPVNKHITEEISGDHMHKVSVVLSETQFNSLVNIQSIELHTKYRKFILMMNEKELKRIKVAVKHFNNF